MSPFVRKELSKQWNLMTLKSTFNVMLSERKHYFKLVYLLWSQFIILLSLHIYMNVIYKKQVGSNLITTLTSFIPNEIVGDF